ncbi:acetate uptake transporter [Kutzneria sp. NPDC051319]|uniref:acetate uptake transporter n=1 Tax=Kutzneria sp. NPDC051319 TaxID=3155047 RepID=UPI00341C5ABF
MTALSASTLATPANGNRSTTATASRIGHALPVGAAGFAWCSLALGLATIGVLSPAGAAIILPGTFFYGGIVQLLAGFFALAAGASFAAAFLTAYGAFWIGYSAIEVYVAPHIVDSIMSAPANAGLPKEAVAAQAGHTVAQSLGVFLIAWFVVTLIFTVVSLGTNIMTVTAFVLLDITIVALLVAYLGASAAGVPQSAGLHVAGYTEIVLAAVAFYIVLAELANETMGRAVFPLFALTRTMPAAEPSL